MYRVLLSALLATLNSHCECDRCGGRAGLILDGRAATALSES
jgi:hypothetical protein